MMRRHAVWGRWLVMFVVAWLISLYVYEVAKENFNTTTGLVLAAAMFGVNTFARWQAAKTAQRPNRMFHFWLLLPLVLFVVVPIAVKIVADVRSDSGQPWWYYLAALLPLVLKLGVPVFALLWVYYVLGKLGRPENAASELDAVKNAGSV